MAKKWVVVLAVLASLVSCSKTGINNFRGYYSFKTGGYVDISGKVYDIRRDTVSIDTLVRVYTIAGREFTDTSYRYHTVNDTTAVRDTAFIRHVANESGQMRVLAADGNRVKVTFNVTGGAPIVFDGELSGSSLSILPQSRGVTLYTNVNNGGSSVTGMMDVSGVGNRYENTIIFDLDLKGEYSYRGLDGTVTASHINCIAVENE